MFITTLLVLKLPAVGQLPPSSPPPDSLPTAKTIFNFKKAPWYLRAMPFSIYTGAGKTSDRVAQTIEIGKSFNVIDVGIAFGRTSLRPDTTLLLEGRVTMDVANYGIFANEMTLGAGRLFDHQGSLVLELAYTIFAQVGKHIGVGLTTGYYDFSNELYDASKTYYGIYFRYGLQRTDSGGLLGIGRIHTRPGRRAHQGHGH